MTVSNINTSFPSCIETNSNGMLYMEGGLMLLKLVPEYMSGNLRCNSGLVIHRYTDVIGCGYADNFPFVYNVNQKKFDCNGNVFTSPVVQKGWYFITTESL